MTSLALRPAVVSYQWEDGNLLNHVDAHYLEFVVDGRPLSELVVGLGYSELVSVLCRLWLDEAPDEVEHLLGLEPTPNLSPGRVALMVCKIDGDIRCGAVTARLTLTDNQASWSDWLWETTLDDAAALPLPPMYFDRSQYEALMRPAVAQLEPLPYDQVAHRGRKFLWPWQWGWRFKPPSKSRP